MTSEHRQAELERATFNRDAARITFNAAPHGSNEWRNASDDLDFWSNKVDNLSPLPQTPTGARPMTAIREDGKLEWYVEQVAKDNAGNAFRVWTRDDTVPNDATLDAAARTILAAPALLDALRECLKLAFKHETQYWLDEPGTDEERMGKIVVAARAALAAVDGTEDGK